MKRSLLPVVILVTSTFVAAGAERAQPSPARYYNPRFSADASRVIFESTRDGKMAIYTIGADGSGLRKLTDGRQDDAQPQWSADGRLITFTSNPTANNLHKVWVMRADGSGGRQISQGPKNDAAPSFSTDSKLVAWAASTELAGNWRDIGVATADGSGAPKLITNGPGNDQAPVWLSGSRLVFVRDFPPKTDWLAMTPEDHAKRRATSEIMTVNADGSGLVNLTKNEVDDTDPSWAAGPKRIFFASTRNGPSELFSMKPDGSDVQRVGSVTGSVSSDGRVITYAKIVGDRSGIDVRDLVSGAERELVGGEKPPAATTIAAAAASAAQNQQPRQRESAPATLFADRAGRRHRFAKLWTRDMIPAFQCH